MPCLPKALPLPTRRDPRLCVPAVQSSGLDQEHLSRLLPFYYVRSWVFSRKELPSAVGLVESEWRWCRACWGDWVSPLPLCAAFQPFAMLSPADTCSGGREPGQQLLSGRGRELIWKQPLCEVKSPGTRGKNGTLSGEVMRF